jgi:hypothetical protein
MGISKNQELLFRYNPWWEGPFAPQGVINREKITAILIKAISSKHIIFLTGLRIDSPQEIDAFLNGK